MDIEQLKNEMIERFTLHEKAILIIDQKIDTTREELKQELHEAMDRILTGQDAMIRILDRIETEKIFLGERIKRVEEKVAIL